MEIDRHGERHGQLDQRGDQQQLADAQKETDQSRRQGVGQPTAEERLQMAGDEPQRDAKLRQPGRQLRIDRDQAQVLRRVKVRPEGVLGNRDRNPADDQHREQCHLEAGAPQVTADRGQAGRGQQSQSR